MDADNTEKATVETDSKHEISRCKNCKLRLENKCPLINQIGVQVAAAEKGE